MLQCCSLVPCSVLVSSSYSVTQTQLVNLNSCSTSLEENYYSVTPKAYGFVVLNINEALVVYLLCYFL